MDQEEKMDFKALRAKFQDEELLKQPRMKPALPEKPKVVPPPQSQSHYLPAGARPSLLTSINQTLDRKSMTAPRVVFKDEKKESKKPLISTNSKSKDKSEGKVKKSKDKTSKGSKEKPEDALSDQKQKKENSKDKRFSLLLPGTPKENTAELVPATPPPKTATKKGFLGFRKSAKKDLAEILADPIMDAPSSDVPGQAPLIPVPSLPEITPETTPPKALLPNLPILPDSTAAVEVTPPFTIPASPDFTPPPAFIPDIPASQVPQSETPLVTETPALPASRPASQNEIIPDPPSIAPTPPPSATSDPSPVASTPSPPPPDPETAAEAVAEAVNIEPPASPSSPKVARPISALSALSRAEDMGPVKKTSPCDQRIFNALEKARRKATSPLSNSSLSNPVTPTPEEFPPSESPTSSIPDLPPIDYEDRAGNAHPKPELVNGFDHRQASPELEGITEERPDPVPELLVVPPPPPPRMLLPDPESLGPPPEKPSRPPSMSLKEFIPPAPAGEENEIPAPPEFSEAVTDIQEFTEEPSSLETQTPEVPVLDWGNGDYPGPDTAEGQDPPEFYSHEKTAPSAGVDVASTFDDQDAAQVETTSQTIDSPAQHELQDQTDNGVYESSENVYEDITTSATKKKGKTDGGKKRKGPPKNPYAVESAQETIEEKSKTGRFGKSDKKAAAESPDEKELKKKEKQRLEKEKKELKEKQEREKKEQKEREKKENEMKKKFKITGQEDAMYQAKVTVTTKGRKNDLPVKDGEIISIIRTTNCPKGKWLARDGSSNYGYVAVDHVELDIKEMLELGKKAVNNNKSISSLSDVDVPRAGSRTSDHYPVSPGSFSDDSEEWTGDDDEPLSPAPGTFPLIPTGHTRTLSMPDMGVKDVSINHQHSHSDINPDGSHNQARHEALHKLATFFYAPKPVEPPASTEPGTNPALVKEEAAYQPEAAAGPDLDLDQSEIILPPPDLYADMTVE
ncbi:uncharacterized protein V6R79_015213 [Siganus canaliculatus]